SATLSRLGHSCTCYENGVTALDAIARNPPAAIVLDLLMPGLDGFQVLARLRQSNAHKDIPVIVWTTKDLSGDELHRLRSSAQVVLQKGLGPSHLATALAACVPARASVA
ncbi:MAG TPA: response regulator, partial [Polyangiaceae bacterium]|nr:response regulator [Polyangiaceae bacterium]